jgi:hypothetical protein
MRPPPQLLQLVATVPNVLWGISRYNLGYSGPTVSVRRSSDGSTVDCYSLADIAAHCAGTNGFVTAVYDQTGQGRTGVQLTGSKQPKVHDSVTGLVRAGSFGSLNFVQASSQNLVLTGAAGFGTGNVAFTVAYATSAWAFPGGSQVMAQVGPDTGGSNADMFYAGRNTSTTAYVACRLYNRVFTQAVDPTSTRTYFVARKAAAANWDTVSTRQAKTDLVEASHVSGNIAQSNTLALVNWGCAINVQQYCQATSQMMALWDSMLANPILSDLEQCLEAIRTS